MYYFAGYLSNILKMNILILGSGGREHAMAWKLSQSMRVNKIFIGPGNAGTDRIGINVKLDPENFSEVKNAVIENKIDIVIVGPEAPLVSGIHDFFRDDEELKSVPVIGPDKSGARLEGSKDYAKRFMMKYHIPTASYRSFNKDCIQEASEYLKNMKPPYVLKADGLAAGKGVLILDDQEEAADELKIIFNGKFGAAGSTVVIEEFLKGIELSVFIITDGRSYKILPEAKDYKRIGEGDIGLNTGGMGAVSPVSFADKKFMTKVEKKIILPTLYGINNEGIKYKGFIFFGIMNVDGEPYLIEYNVRLGDPETEVIMPRIKSDFFELIEGVALGDLEKRVIQISERFVTTVMLVSEGYPGNYEKGKIINISDVTEKCTLFHAGTRKENDKVVTSGGRVIAVSAWGDSMKEALEASYLNAGRVFYEGIYFRKDIGFDL
jgi:phosphoribosylamine--glycine ligase